MTSLYPKRHGSLVRPALLAGLLFSAVSLAEEGVAVFRGAPQNGGPSSTISYRNPGDETFTEQWALTAHLSDGALFTVLFLVHNAGPGDGHASIVLRYLPLGGEPVTEIVESEEPRAGSGVFDLRFGRHMLRVNDGAYEISARGTRIGFVGRLEPLAPPYTPGDGRIVDPASGRYMSSSVMVPRGKLRGELATAGGSRTVEGFGYLDHAEATLVASEISRYWRSLRLHSAEWTVNFLAIEGLAGQRELPFVLVHVVDATGAIFASTDCTLAGGSRRPAYSGDFPGTAWGFACRLQDGTVDASIVPRRIMDRSRGFDALAPSVRLAARLLSAEPYGYAVLHSHEVDLSVANKKTQLRGSGYHEALEFTR